MRPVESGHSGHHLDDGSDHKCCRSSCSKPRKFPWLSSSAYVITTRISLLLVWAFTVYFVFFCEDYNGRATTPHNVLLMHDLPVLPRVQNTAEPEVLGNAAEPNTLCKGRMVYVYNISEVYNREFVRECATFKKGRDLCMYMENLGMGRRFSFGAEQGGPVGGELKQGPWYNTWQFALELYFHERLLRHPCVTEREDIATAFFLPYYAGMDLSRRFTHRLAKDELYVDLGRWLQGRESWKRHEGRDHFMALGRIASDFHREGGDRDWGNGMLRQKAFKEMVIVTIEHTYGRFREEVFADNEVAAPYPTYFHASSDGEFQGLIAWLSQGLQRVSLATMAAGQRSPSTNRMRYRLMTQCDDDPRCTLLRCVGHEASANLSDQVGNISSPMKLGGKTIDVPCNNPQVLLSAMHQSEFCLQPPGDSPTRRSFFDSMLVGCIPVIFHREAAWSQYVHHLPENGESYSVFIPMALASTSNVINILSEIKKSKIKEMRANIAKLIPRILYARLNETPTGKFNSTDQTLDAFDIVLDQVLKKITSHLI